MTPAAVGARRWTLLAAALLAALLVPVPRAWQSLWWADPVEDLSHTVLFAGLAWWLGSDKRTGRGLLWAGAVSLGIAVAIELLQALVGRESSSHDVVLGASGIAAALSIAAWRHGRSWGWALVALLSLLPFADGVRSLLGQQSERRQLARQFPLLGDFEASSLAGWSPNDGATLARGTRAPGEHALVVHGGTGSYPGASLTVVVADWSRIASIEWDARVDGPETTTFSVRLDDDRSLEDDGWLGAEFVADGSWRHYEWQPNMRFGAAPGRPFRLDSVSSLTFYTAGPAPGRRLWLDAIRVKPAS